MSERIRIRRNACPKCAGTKYYSAKTCWGCRTSWPTGAPAGAVPVRFMQYVYMEPMSGCWLWTGSIAQHGYGVFGIKGHSQRAHRVSWAMHRGKIPDGLYVCHRCDVPSCVNPAHLFLGTQRDNIHDCIKKGRARHAGGRRTGEIRSHCEAGHALTENNLVPSRLKRGLRQCLKCKNECNRNYRARQRASADIQLGV